MSTIIETCPTLEEIAAFLDGRGSEEERARVVAHLADCASCYAVFAETSRFLVEDEEEEGRPEELPERVREKAKVIPFPAKRILTWALPIAAVAAMLVAEVATVRLYQDYNRLPETASAGLVGPEALANLQPGEALRDRLWGEVRRGGESEGPAGIGGEVLLGAHLVDLDLALLGNDVDASRYALSAIHRSAESLGLTAEQTRFYKGALEQIAGRKREPRDLVQEAARAEEGLRKDLVSEESPFLAVGLWTEAARLAAIAQQPGFFRNEDNRKLLRWLVRHDKKAGLSPEAVGHLRTVQDLAADSGSLPYPALAEELKGVLRSYQNPSAAGPGSRF